jgi:prevent-host-death family protein
MDGLEAVGVRELRQNLSVYLERVKRGESLTVTEHRQIVAVLQPARATDDPVARLIAEGRAIRPARAAGPRPKPLAVKLKRPLSRVLDELRSDTI